MKTLFTAIVRCYVSVLFLCLPFVAKAQQTESRYTGFEVNFGIKSTKLTSDLSAISNMEVMEEGGSLGFVMGNDFLKARLQAVGFYYSSSSVRQTVNMIESALMVNLYPIAMLTQKGCALNPYVSGGADYSSMKFFGHYGGTDTQFNFSSSRAPYVGQVLSTRGTVGAGLEWRLKRDFDFVHLFAEARYSFNVSRDADEVFAKTQVANTTSVNLGVSFGFLR